MAHCYLMDMKTENNTHLNRSCKNDGKLYLISNEKEEKELEQSSDSMLRDFAENKTNRIRAQKEQNANSRTEENLHSET